MNDHEAGEAGQMPSRHTMTTFDNAITAEAIPAGERVAIDLDMSTGEMTVRRYAHVGMPGDARMAAAIAAPSLDGPTPDEDPDEELEAALEAAGADVFP